MGGVTVSRSIVKWFEGKEMALAMGIEMAVARLGVFAVFWLSPMIAEQYGTVRASVFFGTCLLVVALLLYVVYFFMDRKLDHQLEAAHAAIEQEEEEPFKFRDLGHVFGNSMFWIFTFSTSMPHTAVSESTISLIFWLMDSRLLNSSSSSAVPATSRSAAWANWLVAYV